MIITLALGYSLVIIYPNLSSLVTPMPSGEETPPTTIETEHDRREKQVYSVHIIYM